jgi:hypothetical protein
MTSPLSGDTTYVLTCDNNTLVDHVTIGVTLQTPHGPPYLTVSQNPVALDDEVTLTWDTNNSNESLCSLTGGMLGSSHVPIPLTEEGSETGSVPTTVKAETTYRLTCPHGSVSKTVKVIPISFEH